MPKVICSCGAQYKLPDDAIGKRARCKKCGAAFQVRADSAAPDEWLALAGGETVDAPRDATPFDVPEALPLPAAPVRYVGDPHEAATRRPGLLRETLALARAIPTSFRQLLRLGNAATLIILCAMLYCRIPLPFAGYLGVAGMVIISGWYMAFLLGCVESAAANEDDLPPLAGAGGMIDDVVIPLAKYLLATVMALTPYLLTLLYAIVFEFKGNLNAIHTAALLSIGHGLFEALRAGGIMAGLALSLAGGMAFFPILLLVAAVAGVAPMFRVDLMARTIAQTLPAYVVLLATNLLAVVVIAGIDMAFDEIFGADLAGQLQAALVEAPVLLIVNVISFRAIGLYYHHCKHRFAWKWE